MKPEILREKGRFDFGNFTDGAQVKQYEYKNIFCTTGQLF